MDEDVTPKDPLLEALRRERRANKEAKQVIARQREQIDELKESIRRLRTTSRELTEALTQTQIELARARHVRARIKSSNAPTRGTTTIRRNNK
ncbi:MAG: hypothetical protein LKJ18_03965 [Ancrocorticia sp.]|jgi:chromosome segregation ATPase|nr:hypothetical protein [Ancrocorticia sp.]MCI2003095.1 hypothetical protein [Ancrocorticia sp.]